MLIYLSLEHRSKSRLREPNPKHQRPKREKITSPKLMAQGQRRDIQNKLGFLGFSSHFSTLGALALHSLYIYIEEKPLHGVINPPCPNEGSVKSAFALVYSSPWLLFFFLLSIYLFI